MDEVLNMMETHEGMYKHYIGSSVDMMRGLSKEMYERAGRCVFFLFRRSRLEIPESPVVMSTFEFFLFQISTARPIRARYNGEYFRWIDIGGKNPEHGRGWSCYVRPQ